VLRRHRGGHDPWSQSTRTPGHFPFFCVKKKLTAL
jgi:hypothetical protein